MLLAVVMTGKLHEGPKPVSGHRTRPTMVPLRTLPSPGLMPSQRTESRESECAIGSLNRKEAKTRFATRNKCIASSHKCLTSSNKKLLGTKAKKSNKQPLFITFSDGLPNRNGLQPNSKKMIQYDSSHSHQQRKLTLSVFLLGALSWHAHRVSPDSRQACAPCVNKSLDLHNSCGKGLVLSFH